MIKLDENRIAVGGAITDNANQDVAMLKCDPVTNRLLIEITPVVDSAPPTGLPNSVIDGNRVNTATGVTDDANLDTSLLIADNRNGYLYIDLIIE
jgi:hypothetical protein